MWSSNRASAKSETPSPLAPLPCAGEGENRIPIRRTHAPSPRHGRPGGGMREDLPDFASALGVVMKTFTLAKITVYLLFAVIMPSCSLVPPRYNPPQVPLEELTPDLSLYPEGWSVESRGAIREYEGEIENIGVSMRFNHETSVTSTYTLYRYRSTSDAAEHYDALRQSYVRQDPTLSRPSNLVFTSTSATSTSLQCSRILTGLTSCIVLAQYGEYVMKLLIPINSQAMTRSNITRILTDLDQKLTILTSSP